ncbi:MAG: hypothetical protein ACLTS6_17755 [Anaerobutyricum sp.]
MIKSKEKQRKEHKFTAKVKNSLCSWKVIYDKLVIIKSCCMIMIEKHQCCVLLVILEN